jgi:hypothetical protein
MDEWADGAFLTMLGAVWMWSRRQQDRDMVLYRAELCSKCGFGSGYEGDESC